MLNEMWEAFKDALKRDPEFRITAFVIFAFFFLLAYGAYCCFVAIPLTNP